MHFLACQKPPAERSLGNCPATRSLLDEIELCGQLMEVENGPQKSGHCFHPSQLTSCAASSCQLKHTLQQRRGSPWDSRDKANVTHPKKPRPHKTLKRPLPAAYIPGIKIKVTMTKRNLGRKWAYSILHLVVHHPGRLGQEAGGRN